MFHSDNDAPLCSFPLPTFYRGDDKSTNNMYQTQTNESTFCCFRQKNLNLSKHSHRFAETWAWYLIYIFDSIMWDSGLLLFGVFQSHEKSSALFHFQVIRSCYLLFHGQSFLSEYKDRRGQRVLVIISAWKQRSYLLLSGFTCGPNMGLGKYKTKKTVEMKRQKRQKRRDTPWLRQLGLIVCGER